MRDKHRILVGVGAHIVDFQRLRCRRHCFGKSAFLHESEPRVVLDPIREIMQSVDVGNVAVAIANEAQKTAIILEVCLVVFYAKRQRERIFHERCAVEFPQVYDESFLLVDFERFRHVGHTAQLPTKENHPVRVRFLPFCLGKQFHHAHAILLRILLSLHRLQRRKKHGQHQK